MVWLRVMIAAAGTGAAALSYIGAPFSNGIVALVLLVLGAVLAAVAPDGRWPILLLAAVFGWHIIADGQPSWWQVCLTAVLCAAFHLGCAQAAGAPPKAQIAVSAWRQLVRTTASYLVLCAAAIGLALGVAALPGVARGSGWVVAFVIVLAAWAVVLAVSSSQRRRAR